ncbi:MAG: HAMP domain-containing histidine kinase [Geothrix sp.]|uniref:sensor histidine kinase n=1 Tax=Geothrix sp. TaxID=1962974 RepID=UPI0017B4FA38|nr:HAMP domain-containing sensor histidine kinase [Geothrix sp.]NWJ39435.1 HAMP domain-containing histidine kinase [Geothrix sp.]WIL19340.1 MAG: HAMP domain-containing histidine kinase [Geothrix sp.]
MPPLDPATPPDRLGTWPRSTAWLLMGYGALGLGTLLLAPAARGLGLNSLNTLVFAHAGLLTLERSRREPDAQRGWWLFSLGLFAQAINQGWATLHMFRHGTPPPFPAWGDLFSFLSLGLIIASLLAWPLTSASGSERWRKGMDGLGAALSAFFLGWYFTLGPLFRQSQSSRLERTALVAFFLGNAMVLGTCAYLGARQTFRFRGPLGWITLGFGISMLQVMLQVPLALAGRYHLGDPVDLLVLLAALFILLAPLAPRSLEPGLPPSSEIRDHSPAARILPMLPAATSLALVLISLAWAPTRLDPVILALAAGMAGLGLFRGGLALRDLQHLSVALETRVLERTQDLEVMQDAMLRTERMNAMAVLGAGMAHDLNNTLATVRACAELARMKLEDGQIPEIKDLDHILVAADQSAALTRRLMSFGHMEEAPPRLICLREELSHLETILRMLLGRQISLRLELGEDRIPVLGSRAQIEQILVNLVGNARDAMPHGGDILIRLSRSASGGKPIARVEVEDSGEGMTPEVQEKIFSPFFTTKGPGRGTGLGLASVRQLMHDLGGTLAVASQPGIGTTFVLRLPLVDG